MALLSCNVSRSLRNFLISSAALAEPSGFDGVHLAVLPHRRRAASTLRFPHERAINLKPSFHTSFQQQCLQYRKLHRPGVSKLSCRAAGNGQGRPEYSKDARARAEVLSPFRTVRQFFYIAFMASGGLGTLITLSKVASSLSGIDNGVPLESMLKDLGIDIVAVVVFAFLYSQDAKAKNAQLARLGREESLGQLRLELMNKRIVTASSLRGKARLIIVAGPPEHVEDVLESAKPFKDQLVERGCLVVPLVAAEGKGDRSGASPSRVSSSAESSSSTAPPAEYKVSIETERRWKANPLYTNEWRKWLDQQMELAKVGAGTPVYISLRLDGRVRASGVGSPPWPILVAQLGKLTGSSFMDGFDGSV